MSMIRYGDTSNRCLSRGLSSSTYYLRMWGTKIDPTLPPVVILHGFPDATTAATLLDTNARDLTGINGYPVDALLATGRTLFIPFTGSNWGLPTVGSVPGTDAVDTMVTAATALGIDTTTIDIIGGSMGGCNAINWCVANPTMVHKVIVYNPLVSFDPIYDLGGSITTSLDTAYSVDNKTDFMVACADYDPIRMDVSAISSKMLVIGASNDTIVPYSTVTAFCNTNNIPLITTATGHLSLEDSNINELALLKQLMS